MISEAITKYGAPEISNSDRGRQFTSEVYTALFHQGGVAVDVLVSMDGKGRARSTTSSSGRFWRMLKDGHLYLSPPVVGVALYQSCERF